MADEPTLAAATGLGEEEVAAVLATLAAEGMAERAPSGPDDAWLMTPGGLTAHGERVAALREQLAPGGVAAAYDSFLELNEPAKRLVSRSQQGALEEAELLIELEEIAERVNEALGHAARHERRFAVYGERFDAALERIGAGELRYVDDPEIDSFHTVWFECHEDFLLTLGLRREE
ncbi:MAG: hypothetical protein U0R71_10985 [Solirubrobacterales bacterium]